MSKGTLAGGLWLVGFLVWGTLVLCRPLPLTRSLEPVTPSMALSPGMPPEALFRSLCATCHGPRGEGSAPLEAPSIAGLPAWFVRGQLEKFRLGWRGASPEDAAGQRMRAVALLLPEESLGGIATLVAGLEPVPTRNTLGGKAAEARDRFAQVCAGCHRHNAHGDQFFHSAPLSSLPDWYLAAQLHKFREGSRGYHASDAEGAKMRQVLEGLPPEEISALAAVIAELAAEHPPEKARWREALRR